MQVALIHQVAADVGADACFEEHVVGQHDGGAATRLEAAVNVLQKGELLIAGLVGEGAGDAGVAAAGGAEGGIGEDDIGGLEGIADLAEGVAEADHATAFALDIVQQAIHQSETAGVGHQLDADEGFVLLKFDLGLFEAVPVVVFFDVGIGRDEEAGGAGGGVLNDLAKLRLEALDHGVDQGARGEVLAGAGFGLVGVLFEQAFVEVAEAVFGSAEPIDVTEVSDQLLQVTRLTQAGLRFGIDGSDQRIVALGEVEQHLLILVEQDEAGFAFEVGPAAACGQRVLLNDARFGLLVHHLGEEQEHEFRDVVAVVDAVVAEDVAEVPEFLDDGVIGHWRSLKFEE